jgi:hypothetical protein
MGPVIYVLIDLADATPPCLFGWLCGFMRPHLSFGAGEESLLERRIKSLA